MQIRTSKPAAGNKFYTTQARGGYSACIQGKPTDACDVLANCVGYACGRFNEIIGSMKYPYLNCNAQDFIERAQQYYGLQVVPYPTLGGILVWGGGGCGHVAVVERIDGPNQIYTSESGYGSTAFWNSVRYNSDGKWGIYNGYWFRGCIINPAIGDVHWTDPTPTPTPTDSTDKLACDVVLGRYGVGEDRKKALGNRYNEVQARVNEMILDRKSIDAIAKEVIDGRWQNYPDRKAALEACSYNYNEVQAKVNEILGGDTPAPTPTPAGLQVGDKVKVLNNTQYTGGPFAVYYDVYDVIEVNGDRVVIGIGAIVTAAVNIKNLQKV